MRKIIVNSFVTLDGVIQAPGGPEEDSAGDFKYGGWMFNYGDEISGKALDETMDSHFDLLLGRRTYEIFAAYWPYKDGSIAEKFNTAKKYVVSGSLDKLDWNNSSLIKNDVPEEIRKLKNQSGPEFHIWGSSNMLQTLIKNNLIDEFRLMIFPVILGKGKRLFGEGLPATNLKFIDSKISTTGVIITRYQPAGAFKVESIPNEKPSEAELARRIKHSKE